MIQLQHLIMLLLRRASGGTEAGSSTAVSNVGHNEAHMMMFIYGIHFPRPYHIVQCDRTCETYMGISSYGFHMLYI